MEITNFDIEKFFLLSTTKNDHSMNGRFFANCLIT